MTASPSIQQIHMLPHFKVEYEQRFALMGENLLFQTNQKHLIEVAEEAFGRFPFPASSSDKPLIVRLFAREGLSNQPDSWEVGSTRPNFSTHGHLFTITYGIDNLGIADLQQGFAFGYVTPQVASEHTFVRYTFIEGLSLAMLSLNRNYVPIHAACVVKNGVAVILQASAGTGKSTLAYACMQRGYQLLAEDVVHVKICTPQLQLWGAPWKFHLLPDAIEFFPELATKSAQLQMNHEWKLELDLDEHFPGLATVCAKPGPIILLRRGTADATGIAHLDSTQALSEFEVLWPWDSGWTEYHEKEIHKLLAGGAYILHMDGSPDEAVDSLDHLLDQIS